MNFEELLRKPLIVDTLPLANSESMFEEFAFDVYLLGHDNCANHQIQFSKNSDSNGNKYDIHWTGLIGLAYSGDDEFCHEF